MSDGIVSGSMGKQATNSDRNRDRDRQTYLAGVVLVCLSAVVFSTAGLFTKGVGADAWSVIFWRGISAALLSVLFLALRSGVRSELARFDGYAWGAALLLAAGTAAFIPAFKLTTIANVAMIWAAAPFVSALLAWLFIRERPSKIVLAASGLAMLGVVIIVGGSIGTGHWVGDLLACWMTVMMAGAIVIYRKRPETPTVLPAALSSVLLLPPALWLAKPLETASGEISILLAFGLIFAVASITLSEGAKRLPAAQTALLGALETPLAPLWAFLLFAETPSQAALLGSGIILVAIVLPQVARHRKPGPENRCSK
ncbi:DMT family transporter [Coralliovum pocilloporae]|uniref:DMT family transporter n=1 Tax=Coralliovum pocilloporae TaxID=3066369 RepID=UPI0033078F6B